MYFPPPPTPPSPQPPSPYSAAQLVFIYIVAELCNTGGPSLFSLIVECPNLLEPSKNF